MAEKTIVDILAAKLTGMALAKKYSTNVLWVAHKRNPDNMALQEAFICAFVDDYTKAKTVPLDKVEEAVASAKAHKPFADMSNDDINILLNRIK